jgi:hypothetical protein
MQCISGEYLNRSQGLVPRVPIVADVEIAGRYTKLGFGGAQADSNQRLMYTSA